MIKIKDVRYIIGFSYSALYNLKKRTIEREYILKISPMIYNMYVASKSDSSLGANCSDKNLKTCFLDLY